MFPLISEAAPTLTGSLTKADEVLICCVRHKGLIRFTQITGVTELCYVLPKPKF